MNQLLLISGPLDTPVVNWAFQSTLIMTGLLGIGLFFFLRASGRDRVETRIYKSEQSLSNLAQEVRTYLGERAYTLTQVDDQGIATFVGQGQPSWFLTIFLTGLAIIGLSCLLLVIQSLTPQAYRWSWAGVLLAPLAGWYYRSQNQRQETVRLQLEDPGSGVQLKISGHRDELDQMAVMLKLEVVEATYS